MSEAKDLHDLIERVRKTPGWQVEPTRNGVQCKPPDKSRPPVMVRTMGSKPGDHRTRKNLLTQLRLSGWRPDAADVAEKLDSRRRLRRHCASPTQGAPVTPATPAVDELGELGDGEAAPAPVRRPATARSGGPRSAAARSPRHQAPLTAVQEIDTREMDDPLEEIAALVQERVKHGGFIVELWHLTPEAALVLADYGAPTAADDGPQYRHRPITRATVLTYRGVMQRGDWEIIHDGLAFSSQGQLIDGQHRLESISELAENSRHLPVSLFVTWNLRPRAMLAIDSGRRRGPGDTLAALGHVNAALLGAALRLAHAWDSGLPTKEWSHLKLTNPEVERLARDYPDMSDAVRRGQPLRTWGANPSASAVFVYLVRRNVSEHDELDDFIGAITGSGAGLNEGDPRLALRNFMINAQRRRGGYGQVDWLAILLKTWQYHRMGKTWQLVSWREGERMPGVYDPDKRMSEWRYRKELTRDE